jgi:transposase
MMWRAAEQTRPDIVHARTAFHAQAQRFSPADLVFVDESGVTTHLVRLYGRAPVGERATGRRPAGHYTQITLIGALTLAGMAAFMSVEGATDTAVMVAFTEHILVPTLRPGQVVLMDNLSPHKAPRVRELIERAGCQLVFLPPYSPDFSPIEEAWSKIKTWLRGTTTRTREAIEAALALVLEQVTASDCQGWFHDRGGYVPAPN